VRDKREELIHNIQWWPTKRMQLNSYQMDDEALEKFIARWNRVRPRVLISYVGAAAELATWLASRGIRPASPQAIGVTAAPVTTAQRALIESVFGAPVYDHYRSSEVPWLAGECSAHSGLHTFADVRKVEVLGQDGRQVAPGSYGEVVATDLTNRVFPLVRYRLGDRTTTIDGTCECGVTLPRIAPIGGRVSENLRLPDGQVVAGEGLAPTFNATPYAVRQFQIHQGSDYSVTLRCVPGPSPTAREDIDRVVGRLRSILNDKVPVRLEIVDKIPHDGGKVRYITSDVKAQ
jgi:phenylacetate-CoA ligase